MSRNVWRASPLNTEFSFVPAPQCTSLHDPIRGIRGRAPSGYRAVGGFGQIAMSRAAGMRHDFSPTESAQA